MVDGNSDSVASSGDQPAAPIQATNAGGVGDTAESKTASAAGTSRAFYEDIKTWVPVLALLVTVGFNWATYVNVSKQIELQRTIVVQSTPASFELIVPRTPPCDGERLITIRNAGPTDLVNIEASIRPYFVFADGRVVTVDGMKRVLDTSDTLLRRCINAGLVTGSESVPYLMDSRVQFPVARMSAGDVDDGSNLFAPELSSTGTQNGVRLARLTNSRLVFRCRFHYQHKITRQVQERIFYYLVQASGGGEDGITHLCVGEVVDLDRNLGGKAIVRWLNEFEERTVDPIFH